MESLKVSLQEKDDKYTKMVKTLKAARTRIDTLKSEKDQVKIPLTFFFLTSSPPFIFFPPPFILQSSLRKC